MVLSQETQAKLARLLLAIAEGERQIEVQRQVLAEQNDFESYAAFLRIDRNRLGYVTSIDIVRFLKDNGVYATENECFHIIEFFTLRSDGRLKYADFLNMVLPTEHPTLRAIATQRPNYGVSPSEFLPYDIEYALARVFEKEITLYKTVEPLRQELIKRYDYSSSKIFRVIDSYASGYVECDSLEEYFKRLGQIVYEEDLMAIIRRLDTDADGKLSYLEFVEGIMPNEPSRLTSEDLEAREEEFRRLKRLETSISRMDLGRSSRMSGVTPEKKKRSHRGDIENSGDKYRGKGGSHIQSSSTKKSVHRRSVSKGLSTSKKNGYKNDYNEKSVSRHQNITPEKRKIHFGQRSKGEESIKTSGSINRSAQKSRTPVKSSLKKGQMEYKDLVKSPSTFTSSFTPSKANLLDSGASIGGSKRVMLSDHELKFVKILEEQIAIDRLIEGSKQDLALRPDFNLLDAFHIFDKGGKAFITMTELVEGLTDLGMIGDKNNLYLFMRHFDKSQDGKLRFSDFCDSILPKQPEYATLINNRIPQVQTRKSSIDVLTRETKDVLKKVFQTHLDAEAACERLRKQVNRDKLLNLHELFQACDLDGNGYLIIDEFRTLLKQSGIHPTEKELMCLLERYDRNKDGRVSYSEFVDEMTSRTD